MPIRPQTATGRHALFMAASLLAAATAPAGTGTNGQEKFSFERPLMGTRFTVVIYAGDRGKAQKAAAEAFSLAGEINRTASDYLVLSELSQLSGKAAGIPVPLSPSLYALLEHARGLSEATGGAFDPTLGPMTKLWRAARDSGRLPEPEALAAARAASGWRHFTLVPDAHTITLHRRDMAFDLGGIAKGHAADPMLASLSAAGFPRAMIAAGGDIRLGDPPPGREGWAVALRTFDVDKNDGVLTLANAAVSTSGDLHQSVEIEGLTYSHILDPATGLGLTRRIAATVIADEAKLSDPLATAACVLGPDGVGMLRDIPGVRDVRVHVPKEPQSEESNPSP